MFILNMVALGIALVASIALGLLVMFLPAIFELMKPQDAGPRLISDSFTQTVLRSIKMPLSDVEFEEKFEGHLSVRVLSLDLPNIEARSI